MLIAPHGPRRDPLYPPRTVSFLVGPSPSQLYPASPTYTCRLTDGVQVRLAGWVLQDESKHWCSSLSSLRLLPAFHSEMPSTVGARSLVA